MDKWKSTYSYLEGITIMLLSKNEIICYLCRGHQRIWGMGNTGNPELKPCPNCLGKGKLRATNRQAKK